MPGEHILVIDDCRTIRDLVGEILSENGYSCSLAADGFEGLDLSQGRTPDLVLVDFIMPRMNGLQFMRSFRSVDNHKDIPVILVSVKADSMGENFMRATGAVDALTKPFSQDSLLTVIQHALGSTRTPASTSGPTRQPFLSADRFEPEKLKDPVAEARAAVKRIRERLAVEIASNLPAGDDVEDIPLERLIEKAISDELIASLIDDYRKVDPAAGLASFAGSSEAISVGEIMQLLLHGQAQGTFEIRGQGMLALIFLRNGRVTMARIKGGPDEFLLGRYLLKEDLVTREELGVLLRSPERSVPLGERLVRSGYISRDDLIGALTEQTTEVIYEVLRWQTSRYRFVTGKLPEEAGNIDLEIPVGELLMEGLRRVDEWRVIERHLPDFDSTIVRTPAGIEALGPDSVLSADEARVLDFVNGKNTIREIIRQTRLGSFNVCKILHQLITMKVIRRVDD